MIVYLYTVLILRIKYTWLFLRHRLKGRNHLLVHFQRLSLIARLSTRAEIMIRKNSKFKSQHYEQLVQKWFREISIGKIFFDKIIYKILYALKIGPWLGIVGYMVFPNDYWICSPVPAISATARHCFIPVLS